MPIYTYLCKNCNFKFEVLVGVVQKNTELKCTKCGSKKLEKLFSPFMIKSKSELSSNSLNNKCSSCSGGDCSACG